MKLETVKEDMDRFSKESLSIILALIFLGLSLLYFYYFSDPYYSQDKRNTTEADLSLSSDLNKRVNRNLYLTNRQIELEQNKRKIELYYVAPQVGQYVGEKDSPESWDSKGQSEFLSKSLNHISQDPRYSEIEKKIEKKKVSPDGGSFQGLVPGSGEKAGAGSVTDSFDFSSDRNEFNSYNDTQVGKQRIDYYSPQNEIYRELSNRQIENKQRKIDQAKNVEEFIQNARKHGYEVQVDSKNKVISVKKIRDLSSTQFNQPSQIEQQQQRQQVEH